MRGRESRSLFVCLSLYVCVQRNATGNKQRLNRCHSDITLTNQVDLCSSFHTSLFSTNGKLFIDGCVCVHPPPLPRLRAMAFPVATQALRAPYSHRLPSPSACFLHFRGMYHQDHWHPLYPNPVTTPSMFKDWLALHRANIIV